MYFSFITKKKVLICPFQYSRLSFHYSRLSFSYILGEKWIKKCKMLCHYHQMYSKYLKQILQYFIEKLNFINHYKMLSTIHFSQSQIRDQLTFLCYNKVYFEENTATNTLFIQLLLNYSRTHLRLGLDVGIHVHSSWWPYTH